MSCWRLAPWVGVLLCGACVSDVMSLDATPSLDAGAAPDTGVGPCEMTASAYWDGDAATAASIECPTGAFCGVGGGACGCTLDGAVCLTAVPVQDREDAVRAANPDYPRCAVDADCGLGNRCYLLPGCEALVGTCCWGVLCSEASFLEQLCSTCVTYCGCGGETFEGPPVRRYRHPGPCGPS